MTAGQAASNPPVLKSWRASAWTLVWLVLIAALALLARLPFLHIQSADYVNYVSKWYDVLGAQGASAFGTDFSDYSPGYLYLLWAATAAPASKLLAVKAISVAFDLMLAASAYLLLGRVVSGPRRRVAAFAAVLLTPTVVLNSAAWGQCDSIYAACVLAAVWALLARRDAAAVLLIGAAIAVKAQAIFILPLVLVLLLRRRLDWRTLPLVALPFAASTIVPVLEGRPPADVLSVYIDQGERYRQLTLNAPTFYAWLDVRQGFGQPGIILGGLIILTASLAVARWTDLAKPDRQLAVAVFLVTLVPFVLPRMHERYFYLADVLSVCLGVARPRLVVVPLLIVSSSLVSYLPFLFGVTLLPLWLAAAGMASAIAILSTEVFPALRQLPVTAWRIGAQRPEVHFAAVGATSTAFFLALYALFRLGLSPVAANALSLSLTAAFNFGANRLLTFRARRRSLRMEIPGYVAAYVSGLVASTLVLAAVLHGAGPLTGPAETLVVLAAGGVATVTRYLLLSRFVYPIAAPAPAPMTGGRGGVTSGGSG